MISLYKIEVTKKLTKREKTLLFLLFTLIVFFVLYKIYFPHINLLIKRKNQLVQIKQIANIHQKTNLGEKIVEKSGLSEFIVSMGEMCEKNQVKLISITPQEERNQQTIQILITEIKIKGTLDNILCFLNDIDKAKIALILKDVTLTKSQDNSSSSPWMMSAKLALYYHD